MDAEQATKQLVDAQLFRCLLGLYLTTCNKRHFSTVLPFLKQEVVRWLDRAGGMAGVW